MTDTPITAPAAPAPAAAPPPVLARIQSADATRPSAITDQALRAYQGALKAGHSVEAVTAALKADGFDGVIGFDARTPVEVAADARQIGSHHDPAEYRIEFTGRAEAFNGDTNALAKANSGWQNFLSQIGADPITGAGIAEGAIDEARAFGKLQPKQREAFQREQTALGERIAGGAEAWAAKIAQAERALSRADKATADSLRAAGILRSANMVYQLAAVEGRHEYRAAAIAKK